MTIGEVLYDYVAQSHDEISVKAGMTLTVIKQFADKWCLTEMMDPRSRKMVRGMMPETTEIQTVPSIHLRHWLLKSHWDNGYGAGSGQRCWHRASPFKGIKRSSVSIPPSRANHAIFKHQ